MAAHDSKGGAERLDEAGEILKDLDTFKRTSGGSSRRIHITVEGNKVVVTTGEGTDAYLVGDAYLIRGAYAVKGPYDLKGPYAVDGPYALAAYAADGPYALKGAYAVDGPYAAEGAYATEDAYAVAGAYAAYEVDNKEDTITIEIKPGGKITVTRS